MPANQLFTDWVSGDLITAAKLNNMKNNLLGGSGCGVKATATTSISTGSTTSISFDTELHDTDGFFAPTSTNIVIPTGFAGRYLITANGNIAFNASGARVISIYINGTLNISAPMAAGNPQSGGISRVLTLAAGDVITIRIFQDSGVSLAGSAVAELLKVG